MKTRRCPGCDRLFGADYLLEIHLHEIQACRVAAAAAELRRLAPEDRVVAMRRFCRWCGDERSGCVCSRDE